MLRRTLPFFFVFAPTIAFAQTPTTIASGTSIQIPVPANAQKPRLQVLLAGTQTVLDDERANVQNGVAVARLEADPGLYDVRLVSNDKARTTLGALSRFQIPGFKREAGRWLFNGSPVVYEGTNPVPVTSFVPNLRRDKKTKLPFSIATNGALKWNVAVFNGVISTPKSLVLGAAASGFEGLIGVDLTTEQQRERWASARASLDPSAAFLLSVGPVPPLLGGFSVVAHKIEATAPLADAVVVDWTENPFIQNLSALALLKVARRNVEESPNFDLPVFARFKNTPSSSNEEQTARGFVLPDGFPPSPNDYVKAFQAGASNIIVPDGTSNPVLDVLTRQSARFSGAVTLEDVGMQAKDFDRFAPILRRAGRVPLLARLPGDGNGEKKSDEKSAESLFVSFDFSTELATLDKIERAAKVGATIYCEGVLPPALFPRWSEITKTQIAPLPAPRKATLTLSEPWFWGTINDQNFDVSQSLTVTVKPSIAAQTKDKRGVAVETVARPIASFNGDPNGIMLCPVDKGRVIWAPFDVSDAYLSASARGKTQIAFGRYGNDLPPSAQQVAYYAAIAGAMQPALVEYAATKGDASGVSVALRALPADAENPRSSAISLVAFFNESNAAVELDATVRGNGLYALDLMTDQTIPVKVRDFGTKMALSIPANGFRWIAVAKDAQGWNDAGKDKVKARLQ